MSTTIEIYTVLIPQAQRKAVENFSRMVTNGDDLVKVRERLGLVRLLLAVKFRRRIVGVIRRGGNLAVLPLKLFPPYPTSLPSLFPRRGSSFARGEGIVGKEPEAAVTRCSQRLNWDQLSSFQHAIIYYLGFSTLGLIIETKTSTDSLTGVPPTSEFVSLYRARVEQLVRLLKASRSVDLAWPNSARVYRDAVTVPAIAS